jgi:hypothetical protein
MLLWDAHV